MVSDKPLKHEIIEDVAFGDALGERYLSYALSTIMSRSLPDVRDGLKPVHRRLLYAMLQLKLDPTSGFKKCARVVGDVIGKYHPHGDVAVYDALVRLAQHFAVRYPLVDGQGNFGSIDGDNAAAMRYTEARLTAVSLLLLQDIENETVEFRDNYDGSDQEPVILPANFPNLLANGAEGIAVGMATSIPPHNVAELCDALLHLIKKPNASVAELLTYVKGPDFPTGGVLVEPQESIQRAYETGRGSFRLRAKWHKEQLTHGLYQVIVTEIPYQVQKGKLIEHIAELFKAKKLGLLGNIADESAEEIRIVLEPKNRSVDPEMLMESLFKLTDLEVRVNLNMNVLTGGTIPQVLNLKEVLSAFLAHRVDVVEKRTRYRLGKIAHRLEVLAGFLVAYLNLDEVIRIIREEDEPKLVMQKRWGLTEIQVEAILNMRLRSLRRLEEIEIKKENDALLKEQADLQNILDDEKQCRAVISQEIKTIKKQFSETTEIGKRRTDFGEVQESLQVISVEAFIEKEPVMVIYSQRGWIRTVKGHQLDHEAVKYKDGDAEQYILKSYTTDKLLIFASNGRCYTVLCDKLPKGKGFGEPLRLFIDLENDANVIQMHVYQPEQQLLLISNAGRGFVMPGEEALAQTKQGKQVLSVKHGDKPAFCLPVIGDAVAMIGENRKMMVLPLAEIPVMKRGQGVQLQRYQFGCLSDAKMFAMTDGLTWQLGDRIRSEQNLLPWLGKRGMAGRLPPAGFPRTNKFA